MSDARIAAQRVSATGNRVNQGGEGNAEERMQATIRGQIT